ncbi:MAG: CvpA family protein [Ginsengibacter sp.]
MIIDIAFIIAMLLAIFRGFSKGFIIAIFSLLAFIIGIAAALKLSAVLASYLQQNVMSSTKWLPFLSFFLVFIAVVLLVGFTARIIKKTFQLAMLGWLDRLAGVLLYIVLYTIILSIMIFFIEKMLLLKPEVISASHTYWFIKPWGPKVIDRLGDIIPIFKDMFIHLQSFFESIAKNAV